MTDSFIIDKAYEEKIQTLVMGALMDGLKDEHGNVVLRTGEIANVMLHITAMAVSTSDVVSSPTKTREFADQYAKRLRNLIRMYQEHAAINGPPLGTVVNIQGKPN